MYELHGHVRACALACVHVRTCALACDCAHAYAQRLVEPDLPESTTVTNEFDTAMPAVDRTSTAAKRKVIEAESPKKTKKPYTKPDWGRGGRGTKTGARGGKKPWNRGAQTQAAQETAETPQPTPRTPWTGKRGGGRGRAAKRGKRGKSG